MLEWLITHLLVKIDKDSENHLTFGISLAGQCKASQVRWHYDKVATVPLWRVVYCTMKVTQKDLWQMFSSKRFLFELSHLLCAGERGSEDEYDVFLLSRSQSCGVTTNKLSTKHAEQCCPSDTGLQKQGDWKDCLGHLGSLWGDDIKNTKFSWFTELFSSVASWVVSEVSYNR